MAENSASPQQARGSVKQDTTNQSLTERLGELQALQENVLTSILALSSSMEPARRVVDCVDPLRLGNACCKEMFDKSQALALSLQNHCEKLARRGEENDVVMEQFKARNDSLLVQNKKLAFETRKHVSENLKLTSENQKLTSENQKLTSKNQRHQRLTTELTQSYSRESNTKIELNDIEDAHLRLQTRATMILEQCKFLRTARNDVAKTLKKVTQELEEASQRDESMVLEDNVRAGSA